MIAVLACCIACAASPGGGCSPWIHQAKSACMVTSRGVSGVSRSCSRTCSPSAVVLTLDSTEPGSAVSAQVTARPRSRDRSPDRVSTCSPTSAAPSGRTIAAAAVGSTVASVTSRPAGCARGKGAVADGTNSRSATSWHSAASPAKGRLTMTSWTPPGSPWQALYLLPEPHGHGCRGLYSPSARWRAFVLVTAATLAGAPRHAHDYHPAGSRQSRPAEQPGQPPHHDDRGDRDNPGHQVGGRVQQHSIGAGLYPVAQAPQHGGE